MRAVFSYLINMIPYLAITLPVWIVVRLIALKHRDEKPNWLHEIALCLFVLWCAGTASQTIIPKFEFGISGFGIIASRIHEINLIPFRVIANTYREAFVNGVRSYFFINFLGNIMMFVPFGFFVPLLWNQSNRKVVLSGCLTSVFIEICQLFLYRSTDIDDVILNTTGVILGLLAFHLLRRITKDRILKLRKN